MVILQLTHVRYVKYQTKEISKFFCPSNYKVIVSFILVSRPSH